jgi:glycosyltransferase involved in cell wall biosynthesis
MASVIRVLLVHAGIVPHYRIPIYNYLSGYLTRNGFELIVTSNGIQSGHTEEINFAYEKMDLSTRSIVRIIKQQGIDVVIDFMQLRNLYLFPTYIVAKCIMRRKFVYWGQGRDLADPTSLVKNIAYRLEQWLADSIILYGEHLKRYIPRKFYDKTFVANNTLYVQYKGLGPGLTREGVLHEYGIKTKKNIICTGRMQPRKRLGNLVDALSHMNRPDVGLILVGPDNEGVLSDLGGENVYKLGPIYGDRKFDLLFSADVYCLPGAVGLSIIDAFYSGLPFVTEDGDESAEIMYLKDGVNGFVVPRGDVRAMAEKLMLLIDDDELRQRFSIAAKKEITENGSIDKLCVGFRDALWYAVE